MNPEEPQTEDLEDLEDQQDTNSNFVQDRTKEILPTQVAEGNVQRGEIEKLARFFAQLPLPEQASTYFFGFLNQQQMYSFMKEKDAQILRIMLDKAAYSYMNSCAPWQWKREHTILLENVKALFYTVIMGSVGTKENIQNLRTALNELRINRQYSDTTLTRRGFWKI